MSDPKKSAYSSTIYVQSHLQMKYLCTQNTELLTQEQTDATNIPPIQCVSEEGLNTVAKYINLENSLEIFCT